LLAFGPNGRSLARVARDGTVQRWDPQTDQPIATLRLEACCALPWAISPDGKTLAGVGTARGGTVRLWDTASRQETGYRPRPT